MFLLIMHFFVSAQDTLFNSFIIDGDTLLSETLQEVTLVEVPKFSSLEEEKKYYILKRKVLKVYPYALISSNKLDSLYLDLNSIDKKRKKKKLIKEREKFLREEFAEKLKKLTRSEGLILVKLIYREQGKTVHSYIKELKSGISAGFWQITAKIYDNNLKAKYNPEKNHEDALIENILIRNGLVIY